ncbi:MAG: hypothetical protein IIC09_00370, partial [Proteobacteria bacterium]|nr:hypothetical protein [Pseudomonadota bacterium]
MRSHCSLLHRRKCPPWRLCVELPQGLDLYFNIHKGEWLDQDLFLAGQGEGPSASLPQIVVSRAKVHLRADGILIPPEQRVASAGAPGPWFDFDVSELSLVADSSEPDQFALHGLASGIPFGNWELGGSVKRDGTETRILFSQAEMDLGPNFISVLATAVRETADQFQLEGTANIACDLTIVPNRPLDFHASIQLFEGSLCYYGFPVAITDASADFEVRNNNIVIHLIEGRRGGATVRVSGAVLRVGTPEESLHLDLEIRDIMVDEKLRLALLPARLQPDNAEDFELSLPFPEDIFAALNEPGFFVPGHPEWDNRATSSGSSASPPS